MNIAILKRRLGKARVVVINERRQERIAGRNAVDAAQPHLLHQPVLQRSIGSLHTTLGLRGVSANDVDVQRMQSPAELGHAIAADRILLVDPEHHVLVGVECHRLAMTLQIASTAS